MKQISKYLISSIIILILKVVGGIFLHSYTLLASSIFEVFLIINSILTISKDNNTLKKIISIIYSFIFIASLVFLNYISITTDNLTPSLLIILILIVSLIIRYIILVLGTNKTLQKRNGILSFANVSSNQDFLIFIIVLVSIILCKIGKWVNILTYSDKIGCGLISMLLTIKLIKILINNFKEPSNFIDEYTKEINSRKEISNLSNLKLTSFGGIRKLSVTITPKDNISLVDITSFILNLDDYLLKKANVIEVSLGGLNSYRRVIQNAGNSRSRNSKTNSQKKNSRKKNKKR